MSEILTKNLFLYDKLNAKDTISIQRTPLSKSAIHYRPHTAIRMYTEKDGERKLIWEKSNIMTLAAGGYLARTLFDYNDSYSEITPSYNNALSLEDTQDSASGKTAPDKVYLWCCGTDGCAPNSPSQVFYPSYSSWINPYYNTEFAAKYGGIIPFQFRKSDDDLNDTERNIYFGRKEVELNSDDYYAYFFKAFDTTPIIKQQYTNGVDIGSNVYELDNGLDVQTTVTIQLSITKDDCRDFFYLDGFNMGYTLNDTRISSLSLCLSWPYVNDSGYTVYQDIRPITRLNLPSISLIDARLSIIFQYVLYF